MKTRLLISLAALGALLFAAGCQTVETRIREKPDVFAKLDPKTQDQIRQGIIDIGYTEDMVYLALGKPDEKRESINEKGRSIVWIYKTYYERYEGTHMVGYYRQVYWDPRIRGYRLYYEPVLREVYQPVSEERIRVVFENGKATVIEQTRG